MAIKRTSEVFTIREGVTDSVDLAAGQSGASIETVKIPTNLDSLSREVLQIQEVDFDLNGLAFLAGVMSRTGGSIDPNALYVNADIQVILTEVDPATEPGALNLDSPHFIAGKQYAMVNGLVVTEDSNPDTASFNSVASSEAPLYTTAAGDLYLTLAIAFNGNQPASGQSVSLRGLTRVMATRGKADADTYASILTNLFS